ncbi:MAG TPA: cyclic nucleotide-binding domain-containing protein [Methylomirabilota bacterium]|nr:cyclic nucleotide-binding domain-containing protein [Methylomirabilota bacterium]
MRDFIDILCTRLCPTLTHAQAGALLAASVPRGGAAGEEIIREGQPGLGLFFFVSGQVEVLRRTADGTEQPLVVVEAPSLLGEISLITDGPHSATVRAKTRCEFRFLSKEQFRRRLAADDLAAHRLVSSIAALLAQRLMRLSDEMVRLTGGPQGAPRTEDLVEFRGKLSADWSF